MLGAPCLAPRLCKNFRLVVLRGVVGKQRSSATLLRFCGVCIYIYIYTYVFMCTCVHMNVHIHIHIHVHIHIHIHIHTYI